MDRAVLSEALKRRLRETERSGDIAGKQLEQTVSRLLLCEDILLPNLVEWAKNEPLSDIWVKDKYCVGAVMKIRRDDDFVAAFIALDDYAKDPDAEFAIWQRWA